MLAERDAALLRLLPVILGEIRLHVQRCDTVGDIGKALVEICPHL
jgi:hypothetical protein